MSEIHFRTTEVGSCGRKRQFTLIANPQVDIPLPPHFFHIKGWLSHHHIKNWIDNEGDYVPDPIIPESLMKDFQVTDNMLKGVKDALTHDWTTFLKWTKMTDVKLTKDNVLGTELHLEMPVPIPVGVTGKYIQDADIDFITKFDIIDFKSGSKAYIGKYKSQLGSYRRLARYHKLHLNSPTKDFRLINVFLGDDEPQQQVHDPKKITAAMMSFDSELSDFILNDYLIRTDPQYQAPCQVGIYCAFCHWIHKCRGI